VLKLGQEVQARVVRIDEVRAQDRPEHQSRQRSPTRTCRSRTRCFRGLDLAKTLGTWPACLDAAFSAKTNEDWHPGEKAEQDAASDKGDKAG